MRARRVFAAPAVLAGATLLSACALQQAASVPTDLYDLTPKSTFSPALPNVESQLVVEEPTARASVNTDRLAIQPHPLRVQYFPKARWVDRAPVLVQSLMVESFENTGKVGAVGASSVGLRADYVVKTDLREFQARLSGPEPDASVDIDVRLNVKIIAEPEGEIIASRSFGRITEAASVDVIDVVIGFDDALGSTMRDAVEWAVGVMDDNETRRQRRGY